MSRKAPAARVLVCESSASYARSLATFLRQGETLEVIAVCASGAEAVAAAERLHPDLVAMDLALPGAGAVPAIQEITRAHPVPVVVLSGEARRGSALVDAALAAGAVESIPKSQLRLDAPESASATALRHRLRRLAHVRVSQRAAAASPALPAAAHRAEVVGICASTGGPSALATVLADLPGDYPLPVLVVQHMASGFIGGLARWLDERVPLAVAVARDGMRLRRGVWLAPDDAHLALSPERRLVVGADPAARGHYPSADVLLRSMAANVGAGALAVVLTGMGRDGGRGVAEIARAGGCVIAQDEETSVVFGMPRTAIERGAQVVLPLPQIASALRRAAAAEVAA
jgi:two-component system, chemotaxis family, protein-glutamate methylesterase/glutaminase